MPEWIISHAMWKDIFVVAVPLGEKVLRPVLVYLALVVLLRIFGKRELAQLNPFDLVVLLTLSNTVQNAIIGDDNSVTGGVIGAATLLAINYVVVRFLFRHATLDRVVEGEATTLIRQGKVLRGNLAKETITTEELEAAARRQGFANLNEVEEALLEPGGIITFAAKQPLPEQMRHQELLERMDNLSRQVAALRPAQSPPAA
jgi:uncharacterized membrane protein YcaP (DUF421 family)